jgi:hypothetical protein
MSNYARYWDLLEMDRAALSYDDVTAYLNVELMERGALRPKAPTPEPVTEVELVTRVVYGIKHGGYYELEIAFSSAEAVATFLASGAMLIKSDYEAGGVKYAAPFDAEPSVAIRQVAMYDAILAQRATLRENNARKQRNDTAQREYEKAIAALDKETRDMWDDWYRCRMLVAEHARVIETWTNYVAMTRGDETIAWRFLVKAVPEPETREAFAFAGVELPACAGPVAVARCDCDEVADASFDGGAA